MELSFAERGATRPARSILDYTMPVAKPLRSRRRDSRVEVIVNLSDAAVTQVMIPVDDFERGIAFYRDVLGIPLLFTAPPMTAFFRSGAVRLLVGVLPPGQRAERGSAIYFQVADIHGVHSTLERNGVEFRAGPHVVDRTPKSELWLAEFADPDGNQLALMSEVVLAGG